MGPAVVAPGGGDIFTDQTILTSEDFHVHGQCGEGKLQPARVHRSPATVGSVDVSSVRDLVGTRGSQPTSQARGEYELSERILGSGKGETLTSLPSWSDESLKCQRRRWQRNRRKERLPDTAGQLDL